MNFDFFGFLHCLHFVFNVKKNKIPKYIFDCCPRKDFVVVVATPSFFTFPFHLFKSALLLCHIVYGKREPRSLCALLYQLVIGNGI